MELHRRPPTCFRCGAACGSSIPVKVIIIIIINNNYNNVNSSNKSSSSNNVDFYIIIIIIMIIFLLKYISFSACRAANVVVAVVEIIRVVCY